jgi:prepilin-type N-terminal cleavage/methylation domain-containing protein
MNALRNICDKPRRRGFTAFEVLMATAILAFISISVSSALMAGRQQTTNAQNTIYASFLAQELMEEITRLPYTDPTGSTTLGPDSGETSRTLYNCQNDYSGYTDGYGTSSSSITDLAGNAYPTAYQNFKRTVTMSATSYSPTGWNRTVSGLMVTVTVTRDNAAYATLEQFVMP